MKILEPDRIGVMLPWSDRASVKIVFAVGSTTRRLPSKKTARMGDEGKAAGAHHLITGGFAVSEPRYSAPS
jgi:hypothetical protein